MNIFVVCLLALFGFILGFNFVSHLGEKSTNKANSGKVYKTKDKNGSSKKEDPKKEEGPKCSKESIECLHVLR